MTAPDRHEAAAYDLFTHNHPDADPLIIADQWQTDPDLRHFWTTQVGVVLNALIPKEAP